MQLTWCLLFVLLGACVSLDKPTAVAACARNANCTNMPLHGSGAEADARDSADLGGMPDAADTVDGSVASTSTNTQTLTNTTDNTATNTVTTPKTTTTTSIQTVSYTSTITTTSTDTTTSTVTTTSTNIVTQTTTTTATTTKSSCSSTYYDAKDLGHSYGSAEADGWYVAATGNFIYCTSQQYEVATTMLTVVARGDYVYGAWPTMEVSAPTANDAIGTATVSSTAMAPYSFTFNAPAMTGGFGIKVASGAGLHVQSVTVSCPPTTVTTTGTGIKTSTLASTSTATATATMTTTSTTTAITTATATAAATASRP